MNNRMPAGIVVGGIAGGVVGMVMIQIVDVIVNDIFNGIPPLTSLPFLMILIIAIVGCALSKYANLRDQCKKII